MVNEKDTSKIDPNTGNTAREGSTESQVDIAARVQEGLGKASEHEDASRKGERHGAGSE